MSYMVTWGYGKHSEYPTTAIEPPRNYCRRIDHRHLWSFTSFHNLLPVCHLTDCSRRVISRILSKIILYDAPLFSVPGMLPLAVGALIPCTHALYGSMERIVKNILFTLCSIFSGCSFSRFNLEKEHPLKIEQKSTNFCGKFCDFPQIVL